MSKEIINKAHDRMKASLESLVIAFSKIRTGRANASLLDGVKVSYYGSLVPLSQIANVKIEDARTLSIKVWERSLVPEIEKAILKSDLGLNPSTAGDVIRLPLPPLTEETRKSFIRLVRQEAEGARIAIRNIRRDVMTIFKKAEKNKEMSEDELHQAQESIQELTDKTIKRVDHMLEEKELLLLEV